MKLDELLDAVEFVTSGEIAGSDVQAFVSRIDGRIWYVSDAEDEEPPGDLDDESLYVAVPTRRDLDLGRPLVNAFARNQTPRLRDAVEACFHQRGAYRRFKLLLERHGLLDAWYRFEEEATQSRLGEWCEDNGLAVDPPPPDPEPSAP